MTPITADISLSLDGFATEPGPSQGNGLGTSGGALHTWTLSDAPEDRPVLREGTARSGAVVLGRHPSDVVDALTLDLAPTVLGAGTSLFSGGAPRTLVQRSVISASTATHLTYRVFR
jgi:hypothetical protein